MTDVLKKEAELFGTMSLGKLIEELSRCDEDKDVIFDFAYFRPDGLHSYRGFYHHLAIGYSSEYHKESVTVGKLLEDLKHAVGTTFYGWKGGDYKMEEWTPVWVANSGEACSTAIDCIDRLDYEVIIRTKRVEL